MFRSFLILRFSSIVFSRVNRGMILSAIDEIVASEPFPRIFVRDNIMFVCTTAVHNSRCPLKKLSPRFKFLADGAIPRMRTQELPSDDARLLDCLFFLEFSVVRQRTGYGTNQITYLLIDKQEHELWSINSVYCKLDKYGPDSSISKVRNLVAYITIIS